MARSVNAKLSHEDTALLFMIAELRKENAELRDRNSTYLLRLNQEEQCRERWRARALKAEAQCEHLWDLGVQMARMAVEQRAVEQRARGEVA